MRKLSGVLLAGLIVLALTACENDPSSQAINSACSKDGGAVTVTHFTNSAENDAYLEHCKDGTVKVVEP